MTILRTSYTRKNSTKVPSMYPLKVISIRWNYVKLMSRVFANGPADRGSIPGRVIPKTQKMVLHAALLNTRHYKVHIKSKVEQSTEWSGVLPYTTV